jgi:subtilisin family serine protease
MIAKDLRDRLAEQHRLARVAQSTSRVVARIDFLSLVRAVVPMTVWWRRLCPDRAKFNERISRLQQQILARPRLSTALAVSSADVEFIRFAALVGFIDLLMNAATAAEYAALEALARKLGGAANDEEAAGPQQDKVSDEIDTELIKNLVHGYLDAVGTDATGAPGKADAWGAPGSGKAPDGGIFLVNLNRPAALSLFDSRKTVKADAACRVFELLAGNLAFAVIDGGIDATHPAFLKRRHPNFTERSASPFSEDDLEDWSRIRETYDFTILRDVINVAVNDDPQASSPANLKRIKALFDDEANKTAFNHLKIRNDNARDLDWEIVNPLIRVPHDTKGYIHPGTDHGTHVAGILAADLPSSPDVTEPIIGVCSDLSLYDLRVFDQDGRGDEFAILCAIEFVGWMNRDRSNPVIHGVNLSLALRHDVDSFACGQTPICEACNHLVGSGTVVVAAAGNTGFATSANKQSFGSGYQAISITDPGNAHAVITVGSTHRRDPHAYGVSYFSGRGPTGDGRRKPDLLAPGEKITSTIRDGRTQRMDGTSMAAPHVSGAAALLMARYPELIGRPLRIKEILMATATDLQRDRDFQGAGLLDVLRALQSV